MQYRCSSRSVIFAENNNATRAAYTLSLYATEAVYWRKNNPRKRKNVRSTFTPRHSSRASLVSPEKNHVGYFLNSPRS
jgi:hypothetical protein